MEAQDYREPDRWSRLQRQMDFILEIDKAKQIFRKTRLLDGSRYENDAEHSWHLAMMAVILSEHANEPIDVAKVIMMALVHDIVEIDAGDTFAYDEARRETQRERELIAAERIFNLLPSDQAANIRALWDEFDNQETPEARFARAIDRLAGILPNYHNQGGGWRENHVPPQKVRARNQVIEHGSETLWDYARGLIEEAERKGFFQEVETVG